MKIKNLFIAFAFFLIANYMFPTLVSAQRLYGMTLQGGVNDLGALFQYTPADSTYIKKFDFGGTANGSDPFSSVMLASNGNLYGTTYQGGANAFGVLFEFNPVSSSYTKKIDFTGVTNGSYPRSALYQASDGNLYGTTELGGTYNGGVLFQYDPVSSQCIKKHDFGAPGVTGTIDSSGYGAVMQATDGKLYGMTFQGGLASGGVIYQYDPTTSSYSKKHDFALLGVTGVTGLVIGTTNGVNPMGALIQASDGNLYGMTNKGGVAGYGVLFKYNPADSTFTKKLDFGAIGVTGISSGVSPMGSLIQASDGNLYGMTSAGGTNNLGVLFQYNPNTNAYTKKLDFTGTSTGSSPYGTLMQASDGNIYGMTSSGGANNYGVLFQYDPVTSVFKKKFDFAGTNGRLPGFSNLIEDSLATGINVLSVNNTISVAPNPATNQITILTSSSADGETVTVSIINVLGETVREEKLKWSNHLSLDIKDLHSGIYFLRIQNEHINYSQKIVKQ